MSIWLGKISELDLVKYEGYESLQESDEVYLYTDEYESGTFRLLKKFDMVENTLEEYIGFNEKSIDLPYTVLYKTKSGHTLVQLTEEEKNFILNPIDYTVVQTVEETKTPYIDAQLGTEETSTSPINIFKNFLKLSSFEEDLKPKDIKNNILFNIGQPNTGKSYKFEERNLFDKDKIGKYKYLKIPVSGGIGNEYKGLQNTDLAITYDPIKEALRFGEFLQMLMSAIVNPKVPHVVFLDDFHNQDISSLLSEYTPLFKGQQKREVADIKADNSIYNSTFSDVDEFIEQWNEFVESHCADIPIVPLTNRISGAPLKLIYPSNFYLLGAANFNENSLNIFADWEDRAVINYIDPIKSFTKEDENNEFLQCCKKLNRELKELLAEKNIFDYEKYSFGMWKIVDSSGNIIGEGEQKKLIDFFFSMIKNSLKYNNKNSEINSIGWELIVKMQEDSWFKRNIKDIEGRTEIDYKILHEHNIYEDEI
jgi:hypothetical protein